jgi:DNA-binding beta-propeller fold protein YncE
MRKLLLVFLILALPLPVFAVHDIKFISEIKVGQPLFIEVDEEGRIYTTQKDGTIRVFSGDGEILFTLGGEVKDKKPIIKEPVGIDLYEDKIFVTDEALGKVIIFSKDGEYLDSFGKRGSGPKEFKKPRGIFVYNGVIYVADKGNDRVQVFGPNGVYMGSIGVEGEQEDMLLEDPTDVVVDHNGLICAVDNDNRNVKIFDHTGKFVKSIAGITEPYSIALDRDGVYISDAAKYNINKYDFNGERLFIFGSQGTKRAQFKSMAGITVDREGKVYVADTKRGIVQVFSPEMNGSDGWPEKSPPPTAIKWLGEIGTKANKIYSASRENMYAVNEKEKSIIVIENNSAVKTLKVPESRPVSVAVDHKGFLWVLDKAKKRLIKLNENGNVLLAVGSSGSKAGYFSGPTDIAISKNGIIYVADRGNERVQAFNTDGVFLNIIGRGGTNGLLESPLAIALDSDDTLYVLDDDKKTVSRYSQDGRMLTEFGGEGDAEWQFDDPVSIAVTDNEVFVLDAGVNRIKVFTNSGKFVREFGSEGNGKGDFDEPSAIAAVDDIVFLISDTGNNRIQMFKTLHTPSAPVNVTAKGEMRSIELKWDENPETFVEMYRIYRSEHSDTGFREITAVKANRYNDCDVLPDKKYYYRISAVAREGNESLKSKSANAVPTKYSVASPSGLKTTAKEWSVDLSWEPNNEDFIAYYIIYREDGGELKELGRTASAVFSDMSLDADTTYNYRLSAVSTDGIESEKASIKATTLVSTRPPLEIDVLQMDDIFSNTYKIYENEGIGRINIVNNTKDCISRLKVAFGIKEFMDFPWETEIENLPSGESCELVLKAVFNNKILNVTEDTPVQTEIKVSYYEHAKQKIFSKGHTINIYEKHRMGWNERDRIATFITPKDSTVLEFARSVVTQYGDVNDPILYAGALFDAFGVLGLTYMQDPSNPYQITSGKNDFVDYIQYPRETLKRKSGDCDDLVSLYSATLESIGIPTKLLFYPGHILMMFSTGIEGKEGTDTLDGMLVIQDGYVWAPVEVTLVGSSFMKAWEAGSRSYYEWEGKGLDIMDIRSAWHKFKPASLPISDWGPDCIMRAAIEKKFGDESKTIRKIRVRFISKKHIDTIKADPKNVNALLQLGIIYAQAGEAEEALKVFEKALEHDLKNAALKNNLGNVYFLNEKYMEARQAYEEASALDPKDPYIWINLTRCYLQMKMKDEAKEAFRKAQEINPEVSKKYRAISLELMSVI